MPATATDRTPRKNLVTRLLEGIQFAERQHIPVGAEGYGVLATSTHIPAWERDPHAAGLDPIGCAVLHTQPRSSDVLTAACIALDASPVLVAGLEAGLRHEVPDPQHLAAPNRLVYLHGLQVGVAMRSMVVGKVCVLHGKFRTGEALCPICEEQLVVDAERNLGGPTPGRTV